MLVNIKDIVFVHGQVTCFIQLSIRVRSLEHYFWTGSSESHQINNGNRSETNNRSLNSTDLTGDSNFEDPVHIKSIFLRYSRFYGNNFFTGSWTFHIVAKGIFALTAFYL